MKLRTVIATATLAALFYWAPSVIPVRVADQPVRVATIGCIGVVWRTADTAFAGAVPCPVSMQSAHTPWAVIGLGASVLSVITNAIIVSHTECRELSQQEALTSVFLPFIGIAFNQHHNHCHPHR